MNLRSRVSAAGNGVESGVSEESDLARVLDAYLAAIEAGHAIEPEALAAAHPAIAERLLACLSVLQVAGQVAGQAGIDAALQSPCETCLGDFRMLRVIGRGGMGIVFEAEQVSLKRKVALKVLPFAAALDPQQLRRFQIEAQAAAQLHHTNIVPIFSVGCERGVHYYAMQYIEGQTLATLIHDLRALAGLESSRHAPPGGSHHAPRDGLQTQAPDPHEPERGPEAGHDGSSRHAPRDGAGDRSSHHAPRDGSEALNPATDEHPSHDGCPAPQAAAPLPNDSLAAEILIGLFAAQPGASPPSPQRGEGGRRPGEGVRVSGSAFFQTAANLALQAAEALDHAHRLGIIHRDIKPANLLIDVRGNLWITDFGLARMQADSSLTMTGDILGTLRYTSPEQASPRREIIDHRTDVYSLGATLYELLTLHPVHDGTSRPELLYNLTFAEPKPPRGWNRAIPRDLETILLKALVKDVQGRYASARDMADDLRRFLEGRPIRARRPSLLTRAVKWSRRHKALACSAVVVLTLAIASAAIITTQAWKNQALLGDNQRRRLARHVQYVQDIRLAFQLVGQNNLPEAIRVLSRHRPAPGEDDDRSFPCYYLWRLCHFEPRTLTGHEREVYHVEYSPDGKTLASCGQDGTIRLWDPESGQVLRVLRGHDGEVNYVTFSPDGRLLATGGDDGTVRLWDAASGQRLYIIGRHSDWVNCVLFAPHGRRLVSAAKDKQVKIWDIDKARTEASFCPGSEIEAMSVSPNGRTLATAGWDGSAKLWDLETTKVKLTVQGGSRLQGVAFSHDGRYLATAGFEGDLRVWDAQSGRLKSTLIGHSSTVQCVTFSPDDRALVSAGNDWTVRLWGAEIGKLRRVDRSHDAAVWCAAFAPDGGSLASCSADGTVCLRPHWTNAEKTSIAVPGRRIRSMVFAQDGREAKIFSPDGRVGIIGVVDLNRGVLCESKAIRAAHHIFHGVLSPDAKRLATALESGTIALWNVENGKQERAIPIRGLYYVYPPGGGRVEFGDMAFSPDGRQLAVPDNGSTIFLIGTNNGELRQSANFDFSRFKFLSNAKRFHLPAEADTLILYNQNGISRGDLATGKFLKARPFVHRWLETLAVSPDGVTIATGGREGRIELWNTARMDNTGTLPGHRSAVTGLAFSPDGKALASHSTGDRTVKLWDIATRQEFGTLDEIAQSRLNLAFSPDGSTLAGYEYGDPYSYTLAEGGDPKCELILWQAPRDETSRD